MSEKTRRYPKNQLFTALLATIPTFTYGIQVGWLSPMGPLLKSPNGPSEVPVTDLAITWMASAFPLAAICGIPFFSFSSDQFGRKKCIIAVSIFSSISWTIIMSIPTSTAIIIARIVAGLAAGGSLVVIPVYIREISEDTCRGMLSSLVMTVCKLGVILVYVTGTVGTFYVNQSLYFTFALIHAICFVFMPESPVFLVRTGHDKDAIKSLAWLRSLPETDKLISEDIARYKHEDRSLIEMPKVTIMSVVRDREVFSALRMTLCLMGMQTLSGCFALMNYAAEIFSSAGTHWSPNTLAIFVGSLQLAGSFLTTISIEKFGRKVPLICSSFLVGICMGVLGTCFLLSRTLTIPAWLPVVAVSTCIFSYGVGLAPVPFVVMAEVFSFQHRARLAGVAMAFSFFCSSLTVMFFTPIAHMFGNYVVFYIFTTVGLLGGFYAMFFVPETKGKTLAEIKLFWRKKDDVEPAAV